MESINAEKNSKNILEKVLTRTINRGIMIVCGEIALWKAQASNENQSLDALVGSFSVLLPPMPYPGIEPFPIVENSLPPYHGDDSCIATG